MLEDLRPMGLHDAARRLGIDPFEVARLLVVADAVPERFLLGQDHLAKLREVGGIETWWDDAPLPDDASPARARVRAVVAQVLEREHVGDKGTRIDNLWRGLPVEEVTTVQQAVNLLVQEGVLLTMVSRRGVLIAAVPDAVDRLRAFAEGAEDLPALTALWG